MVLSNKQKWIFGCGGCLGLIIVVAIVLGLLGSMFVGQLSETSNKTTQEIFGEEPLPEGYMGFGIPIPAEKGEPVKMAMLVNQGQGNMIMAFDMAAPLKPEELKLLASDPETLKTVIMDLLTKHLEGATDTGNADVSVKDMKVQDAVVHKLPNGKQYPLLHVRVRQERKKVYAPSVVGVLPVEGDHVILLLALEPNTSSSNENADFSASYETLQQEVEQLVDATTLDDRLTLSAQE